MVLDDGDLSLQGLLVHVDGIGRAVFHGVKRGRRANLIHRLVQGIALGRGDLPHGPVIAADVVARHRIAIRIGDHLLYQLLTPVKTVNGARQGGSAAAGAVLRVLLQDDHIELFEHIAHLGIHGLVPEHAHVLNVRRHIADCRVHFLQGVALLSADEDIREGGHAVFIGGGIGIHRQAAGSGAVEMEAHPAHEAVLSVLHNAQAAPLQHVVKGHVHRLAGDHGDHLRVLGQILLARELGHGVFTRRKVLDEDGAVRAGLHGLLDPLAGHGQADALHHAVLAGFDEVHVPAAGAHREGSFHVLRLCDAHDHILQIGVAVGHQLGVGADAAGLGERYRDAAAEALIAAESQHIAGPCDLDRAVGDLHGAVGENPVGIRQGERVLAVFKGKALLRPVGKAGHGLVFQHEGDDGIVHLAHLRVVAVLADAVQDAFVIALKGHRVSGAADHFPDQQLGRHSLGAVGAADPVLVAGSAEGQHREDAVFHILAQPLPAVRGVEPQLIAQQQMMAGLDAPGLLFVDPDPDSVGVSGAVTGAISAQLKAVVVHDLRAVRFIGEIEIGHTHLGGIGLGLHRNQGKHHQAAQEHGKQALAGKHFDFVHSAPSFFSFVGDEQREPHPFGQSSQCFRPISHPQKSPSLSSVLSSSSFSYSSSSSSSSSSSKAPCFCGRIFRM